MSEVLMRPRSALIVSNHSDDIQTCMDTFRGVSSKWQYYTAQDGLEAFDYLEYTIKPIDIVIIGMPLTGISTLEILMHIRSSKRLYTLPVIILAESSYSEQGGFCYQKGATAFIVKSEQPEQVCEQLSTIWNFWMDIVRLPSPKWE